MTHERDLTLDPDRLRRRAVRLGVGAALVLALADVAVGSAGWSRGWPPAEVLDATVESGLLSWFTVALTTLAALWAWGLWLVGRRLAVDSRPRHWLVLALLLTWLAADDGAMIHERVGAWITDLATTAPGTAPVLAGRFPSYGWQLLFLPLFAGLVTYLAPRIARSVPREGGRGLLVLALVLLASAVALDFVQGLERMHPWNLHRRLASSGLGQPLAGWFDLRAYPALVHLSRVLEETLEAAAMALVGGVLAGALAARLGGVRVRVAGASRDR